MFSFSLCLGWVGVRWTFAIHRMTQGGICFCFRSVFCEGYDDTVRQQIQNSTEYIIGKQIALYMPPCIIIPGILGNVLSFMVAMLAHNRSLPFGIYMAALACADTAMLAFGELYAWIMFNFLSTSMNKLQCQLLIFMYALCGNVGAWIIVALTFERYLLVCRAADHVRFRTVGTTCIVLVIIIVVCVGKNVHYFFSTEFLHDPGYDVMICTSGFVRADSRIIFLQVFELCFDSLIPFIFILILNGCIIHRLERQAKTRKDRFGSRSSLSSEAPRDSARGLTVMLIAVSFTFACLTSPLFVFRFYFAFIKQVCSKSKAIARYVLIDNILVELYASNFAINFILYCLTGTMFREDLANIFKDLTGRIRNFHLAKQTFHTSRVTLTAKCCKNDKHPKITSIKNIDELNVADLTKWISSNVSNVIKISCM